jgi:hypothetical protein
VLQSLQRGDVEVGFIGVAECSVARFPGFAGASAPDQGRYEHAGQADVTRPDAGELLEIRNYLAVHAELDGRLTARDLDGHASLLQAFGVSRREGEALGVGEGGTAPHSRIASLANCQAVLRSPHCRESRA